MSATYPFAYPESAEIITPAASSYPVWDDSVPNLSRYIVNPSIPFGDILLHPSGYYRWRCGCNGADPDCPGVYAGYWYDLPTAKAFVQNHMQDYHYIAPPPPAPAPVLTSLSPTRADINSASLTLTLSGSNFNSGSRVRWMQSLPLATTYVSATQLTAILPAAQMTATGNYSLYVINPDYQQTAALAFQVGPALASISPATGLHATAFTITVTGSGFDSAPVIYFNGAPQTTTVVTAGTAASAPIAASLTPSAASYPVYVLNSNSTKSATLSFAAT